VIQPTEPTRCRRRFAPISVVYLSAISRLVGWLVGWLLNGTSTQKGQFVPTAEGRTPAQSAKDGQRDTMLTSLALEKHRTVCVALHRFTVVCNFHGYNYIFLFIYLNCEPSCVPGDCLDLETVGYTLDTAVASKKPWHR